MPPPVVSSCSQRTTTTSPTTRRVVGGGQSSRSRPTPGTVRGGRHVEGRDSAWRWSRSSASSLLVVAVAAVWVRRRSTREPAFDLTEVAPRRPHRRATSRAIRTLWRIDGQGEEHPFVPFAHDFAPDRAGWPADSFTWRDLEFRAVAITRASSAVDTVRSSFPVNTVAASAGMSLGANGHDAGSGAALTRRGVGLHARPGRHRCRGDELVGAGSRHDVHHRGRTVPAPSGPRSSPRSARFLEDLDRLLVADAARPLVGAM